VNPHRSTLVLPLLIMMLAGGCTSGGDSEGIPTAGRAPSGAAAAPDAVSRELQFVACMREAGIDMPDPVPGDTSGRSALQQATDKGMNLKEAFQTALDGCAAHLPPEEKAPPPDPARIEQKRQFAQCMRENGVKDFPDPDPATGQLTWMRPERNSDEAAVDKCTHLLPPLPPSGSPAEPAR